mmetsp:Transcript_15812/g.23210  ORF Transcript_15812/g.23210 Transcript_15812/m.23210 type:complete len:211 (+) Transcript_15812:73-705(+)|eukprot:CAMPEP_0195509590 /NCGR_PEP_ID=MMETSP0794_2-20130614/2481_1 /TAXON_ID=515487 /ORGANISM="Stephanopyxis turris, Strain CCMP 815" /LENGTH=210 /DNA_ID=CAMNT_0040636849 /DNA_START=73 /DNA_END=705 /DNA_ORIENTATION=+
MKTSVLIASMLSSAAAFAPSATHVSKTALNMVAETEVGSMAPLGYFDPLGYITDEDKFTRYRAVERKHGRIAMMAMLGTFVHNNHWTFDGYLSPSAGLKFSDVSTGIGGLFEVPPNGLLQILLFCGFVELAWWPATQLDGDYGVRLGTLNDWDAQPAKEIRQKNAELNNGRAAMMGILGTITHEVVTGQTFAEQAAAGHFSPFGDGQGFF